MLYTHVLDTPKDKEELEEHEYSLLEHALPLIIHDCEKEPDWNEEEEDNLRELFEAWENKHTTNGDRKTGSPAYDECLGWNLNSWSVEYFPTIRHLSVQLNYGGAGVSHSFSMEPEDIEEKNGFVFKSVTLKNYTFQGSAVGMTLLSSVDVDEDER